MAVLLDTSFIPRRRRSPATADQTRAAARRARATAPAEAPNDESARPVWRILRTMQISGELCADVDVAIDGLFSGTIRVDEHTLSTGAGSRLEADVYAHTVLVRGEVIGSITAADRVTLTRTARVHGNIHAPRVEIADGCLFLGSINPVDH